MDEAESAPLHRFLSFCRLLMLSHPRVGAQRYSMHVLGDVDLRPGWNAVHNAPGAEVPIRYILIDPEGDSRSTSRKPDVPDAEINQVRESHLPEFEGSLAQRALRQAATLLAARGIAGYGEAELGQRLAAVEAAALQPLRGETPSVDRRVQDDLARLQRAIASGATAAAVTAPLRDIVRDGLAFRLSVTHAANVLSVLLLNYLRLPSPLDRNSTLMQRLSAGVDHLLDLATGLKEDRQGYKLTPFYEATYLALLFGDAALLICKQVAGQLPNGSAERRSFESRGLFVDEMMAHELGPCLLHPMDLMPMTMVEIMHALGAGIGNPGGLYVGAGGQRSGPVDLPAVWERIECYARGAAAFDLTASVDRTNDPFPRTAYERLDMFLITMRLGRRLQ